MNFNNWILPGNKGDSTGMSLTHDHRVYVMGREGRV